ncbi:hypothetical protein [Cognatishimia sp.]|uniref:hypothetical protein n=1 Tax=Cognatishimia sp. TaxID=2211648 RepID=UPI0035161073
MPLNPVNQAALDQLNKLVLAKADAQLSLREHASKLRKEAKKAGKLNDFAKRDALNLEAAKISNQAIALNQQNLRLFSTRNKILNSESLADHTGELRDVADQAEVATEQIEDVAKAIEQTAALITFIIKFAGLVL